MQEVTNSTDMGNKPKTTEVMQEETDPLVKEDTLQKESSSLPELKTEDDSSMEHKSMLQS